MQFRKWYLSSLEPTSWIWHRFCKWNLISLCGIHGRFSVTTAQIYSTTTAISLSDSKELLRLIQNNEMFSASTATCVCASHMLEFASVGISSSQNTYCPRQIKRQRLRMHWTHYLRWACGCNVSAVLIWGIWTTLIPRLYYVFRCYLNAERPKNHNQWYILLHMLSYKV